MALGLDAELWSTEKLQFLISQCSKERAWVFIFAGGSHLPKASPGPVINWAKAAAPSPASGRGPGSQRKPPQISPATLSASQTSRAMNHL